MKKKVAHSAAKLTALDDFLQEEGKRDSSKPLPSRKCSLGRSKKR